MYKIDDVLIRPFRIEDIPLKIKWINDSQNNKYLHYQLPLEYEKTMLWFKRIENRNDRFDAIIEYKERPIGLIGLLNIDFSNAKAEEYITIGDQKAKNIGISTKAGLLNLYYAFKILNLNKVYAYTETANLAAIVSYRRRGFAIEGLLRDDLIMGTRKIDRYIMGILNGNFILEKQVYCNE